MNNRYEARNQMGSEGDGPLQNGGEILIGFRKRKYLVSPDETLDYSERK